MRRVMKWASKVPVPALGLAAIVAALGVVIAAVLESWVFAVIALLGTQIVLAVVILSALTTVAADNAAVVARIDALASGRRPSDARIERTLRDVDAKLDRSAARLVAGLDRTRAEIVHAVDATTAPRPEDVRAGGKGR